MQVEVSERAVHFGTYGGCVYKGTITKDLAEIIAGKLNQTVRIKTTTKWSVSPLEIEEIQILELEEFELQSNTKLFDELRDSLGDYSNKYGMI
ncbi:MAG: hypothetical protein WD022_02800 [Balneolaceae bacterium]